MNLNDFIAVIQNELDNNPLLQPATKKLLNYTLNEIKLNKVFTDTKNENYNKAQQVSKDKLHVGCGKNYLDEFVNLDMFAPADIIWDVRDSLPFKDNSFEIIFSEHFLEHVDFPVSVCRFLNEAFRTLQNNGQIIIGVPDTELVLKAYCQNNTLFFEELLNRWYASRDCKEYMKNPLNCVNYHMRDQLFHHKYTPHLWGYDKQNLTELLQNAGFSNIRLWEINTKWTNPKRIWGSIYITGEKHV